MLMATLIMKKGIFSVFLFSCFASHILSENVKIKIAEAPSNTQFQSQLSSAKKLSLRVDPAPVTGPVHLKQLNGTCFKGKEKGYDYTVCPFQNVTQKEERISWSSFHGVLGVWHEWLVEDGTLIGMHFTMGERCGQMDREAKVMFNCSTQTKIHNMSESTCHYTIWLDTPLACLRGAMEVFHLLNSSQLKAWDLSEGEYHRGEITMLGLSKQRKRILTEAGLFRLPKPPEQPLTQGTAVHPTVDTRPECEKEKTKIEEELKDLKVKIDALIRDYPRVASAVGFVSSVPPIAANSRANSTSVPHLEGNTTMVKNVPSSETVIHVGQTDTKDVYVNDTTGTYH